MERTLIKAEADAVNAKTANDDQVNLRKALRDTERESESDGGWYDGPSAAVRCSLSIFIAQPISFVSPCVSRVLTLCSMGVERVRESKRE